MWKRLLLFLFCLAGAVCQAQTYRWVDESGEVHYSDKRPGGQFQTIDIKREHSGSNLAPHLSIEILPPPFKKPDPVIFLNEFRKIAPLPEWWIQVELKPGTQYSTRADLLALWQSEKRCCRKEDILPANRRMFKAAYLSILEYDGDEHALAFALKYLDTNYVEYPELLAVQELALKYFFYYRQKVDWCVCDPGDHIARQIYFLGSDYRKAGQSPAYAALVKKFLDERSEETRTYARAELYSQLAEAYVSEEYYEMAVAVLDEALAKFDSEYGSPAHLNEVKRMKRRKEYINKHYRRKH
jgi:tetratricopeptide (TPR) repeat protein